MKPAARGFTLVEVLVAVAILGICLAAVIGAMVSQARNAAYLKEKTIALWIAHDRLTELQLQKQWPSTGKSDGTIEMANGKWKWQAEVKAAPGEDKLRRIDITVYDPAPRGGALATLSGFLMETK